MTNDDIEKIAQRVAELVIAQLLFNADTLVVPTRQTSEEELLAELAAAMTKLDFELQRENYEACKVLKDKITEIEKKLKTL